MSPCSAFGRDKIIAILSSGLTWTGSALKQHWEGRNWWELYLLKAEEKVSVSPKGDIRPIKKRNTGGAGGARWAVVPKVCSTEHKSHEKLGDRGSVV